MPGGTIFEYKCTEGHRTEKRYPPGTPYDSYGHILCPHCLEAGKAKDAYLIFACPERAPKHERRDS
jgi:hypothetical protein